MMHTEPHERFSAVLALEPGATSAFARAAGDLNPLHHDADFAATTRFGRMLASGPQTTAHLHRSDRLVGINRLAEAEPEFQPEHRATSGEVIFDLLGRIRKQTGETAVGAKGRVLVTAKL